MTSKKGLRIAVLAGGWSNERAISLITGRTITKYLRMNNFSVQYYDTKKELKKIFQDGLNKKFDLAFPALHGKFGEDGTIQGMLEILDIPYVGSGVLASALGMDKKLSKEIFVSQKILTPKYITIGAEEKEKFTGGSHLPILAGTTPIGFPCVVKPNASGSSVGVTIAKNKSQLGQGIKEAFKHDKEIIIEKYIPGKEISVPVLGNENPEALPVVEIVPKTEFFDYRAKYDPKLCDEIVPARIPAKIARKAQKIGIKVHQLLGCRGLSRVDMILGKGSRIYVLELNTIPGLTPNSLFPKSARAAGISFPNLLEKLVKLAYEK